MKEFDVLDCVKALIMRYDWIKKYLFGSLRTNEETDGIKQMPAGLDTGLRGLDQGQVEWDHQINDFLATLLDED